MQFFKALYTTTNFLSLPPSLWLLNDGCIRGKKKATQMQLLDDAAERGVALIREYIFVLAKEEEQSHVCVKW